MAQTEALLRLIDDGVAQIMKASTSTDIRRIFGTTVASVVHLMCEEATRSWNRPPARKPKRPAPGGAA